MGEGVAVRRGRRHSGRSCRHHWIIETPHGVTSRGLCKLCGATKRFPNAAADAASESRAAMGRWSARRGVARPTQVSFPQGGQKNA
ncbi:MAG: hypothetical protein U1B78_03330 [Dehalococcoidia bacterium]|nr:hypothetical protein [Dehalococcoidia bacterium]